MDKESYINIHTHHPNDQPEVIECPVYVIGRDSLPAAFPVYAQAGIHPWFISDWKKQAKTIFQILETKSIQFLGECGLDKVCDTPWELQVEAFTQQIKWSNDFQIPLVIHCVKAYQEIVALLKQHNHRQKVIFHGFMGSFPLAQQLTRLGYLLSFGNVLYHHAKTQDTFCKLPLECILLETDDFSIEIKEVYKKACELKNISLDELRLKLAYNFKTLLS